MDIIDTFAIRESRINDDGYEEAQWNAPTRYSCPIEDYFIKR